MADTSVKSTYWRGVRSGLPFLLVIVPFGMLFGVLATEADLTIFQALAFSVVVIAGAAQFTALQLLQDGAPLLVVIASALAVNLRMAMYSASITPHLGPLPLWKRVITAYFLVDQSYACSILEFEDKPRMTVAEKFAFFMGVVTPICPPWYAATILGAWLGARVPETLGLDFALPIAFLAMIGPMLRTRAHMVAAGVAVVVALLAHGLPFNLGLIVGGVAGMLAGGWWELRDGEDA